MKLNCMKKKMLFPMFSQVHSSKIQGGPNCFCRSSSEFPCSEQPTSPVFSINAVSFYVEQTVTRGRGQNNVCPECRVQPCERDTSFRAKSKSQLQSPEFTHKMQIGLKQMNRGEQQDCWLPDPLRSTQNELLNLQWDGEAGEKVHRKRGWGKRTVV